MALQDTCRNRLVIELASRECLTTEPSAWHRSQFETTVEGIVRAVPLDPGGSSRYSQRMTASTTVHLDSAPPPFAPVLRVLECGVELTLPGHVFPSRHLAGAVLIATESGVASALINGREITHRPGTMVIVAPGFDLLERSDAHSPWLARWCLLEGPWACELGVAMAAVPWSSHALLVRGYGCSPTCWRRYINRAAVASGRRWHVSATSVRQRCAKPTALTTPVRPCQSG